MPSMMLPLLLLSAFGLLVYRVRSLGRIHSNYLLLATMLLPLILMLMGHDCFDCGIPDSATCPSTAMCGIQDFQPTFRPWALNDAAYERAKKLSFKAMNLDAETAYWGFTDFEEVTEEFTMEQVRLGKPEAEKTDRLAEGGGDLLDRMMDKVEATLMKRYEIPGGKNVWMKLEDFDEEEEEDFDEEEEEDWDEEEEEDSDEEEEELFPVLFGAML